MKKGIVITIALILTIFLFSCSGEAPVSVGNSDTYNIPGNEIVGNEKDVGYISIKLPPINGSSKSVSNDEIKTAVGDYTLVLMSDKHTSTSLIYSEQENGFEKVALPVGTYQLVLTAEAVGNTVGSGTLRTTVGIAYTEGVVIEEFKMTKVSMTLSAPELVLEMPEEDIYINSSIVPRVKFSIKGLPSRSNSYVHYEPYIFQEIQKNDNPYLDLVVNGFSFWKQGVYGEFVDLPCSAPSTEGNYIFGIAVRVGIGYADGNNNVLVGNFRFIGYGTGYNEGDAYRYYNDNIAISDKLYSAPITVTVPPTGIELNVGWDDETYTVLFSADENGSVSCASISDVERDSVITVNGATISIGESVVTATPNEGYSFDSWLGLPTDNVIVGETSISAEFTQN